MRKAFFLLAVVLLCFACRQDIPRDILQPGQMQSILWDLALADEMVGYYATDTAYHVSTKRKELYQKIFSIHRISRKDFEKSLRYYEDHPELLKQVLDAMQSKADRGTTPPHVDTTVKRKPFFDSLRRKSRALFDSLHKDSIK